MNDARRFGSVMLSLSVSLKMYGRELTDAMRDVYWHALASLSDADFERAAQVILRTDTDFPPPARFFEILRGPDQDAEAHRALARAWELGKHVIPGQGCWWSGDTIRELVGPAAYEAFHACGGSSAFQQLDSEYHGPGIRKAFVEAYRSQLAADPDRALPLPKPQAPQLPAGPVLLAGDGSAGPQRSLLDEYRAALAGQRAAQIAGFTKSEPLPVPSAEEQAALDRLGEKIAAKRRELATAPVTGGTP